MLDHYTFTKASEIMSDAEQHLSILFNRPVYVRFDFLNTSLSPDLIINIVAASCGITPFQLRSKEKKDDFAVARYHCFNLMYRLLSMTKSEIGRQFDRGHDTVIHGLKMFDTMYDTYPQFKAKNIEIEREILKALSL
ncbi:helix-turn-helix domain-containing protein [Sphingobacterium spiritivorum]|uniref:helix-turn-helix domain-containing protein n=1 Tax=Sphingobacterium spiritivorum TaxID=258 RepID=UPI003DA66E8B